MIGARLLLISLVLCSIPLAHSWFDEAHPCGDENTRMHILKECQNALATLDALTPPDMESALDEHNKRNFKNAQTSRSFKAAKDRANQCVLCVLHGYQQCDTKTVLTGHERPASHIVHQLDNTDFSQNCKDHIETRKVQKQGGMLFRKSEAMVWGSHSLVDPYNGPLISLAETSNRQMVPQQAAANTDANLAQPDAKTPPGLYTRANVNSDEADPTMRLDADALPPAATNDKTTPVRLEESGVPKKEISEAVKPYYLCALVNDTKQVDLLCPADMAITKVLFASYGTPLKTGKEVVSDPLNQRGDINLAEVKPSTTTTPPKTAVPEDGVVRLNGYVLFAGDACFEADFRTRDECSAYDSQSVVEYSCLGAAQCTLRATGDPKVFPYTFQKLICDDRLSLYVKVQCEKVQKGEQLQDLKTLEAKAEMGTLVDDWQIQSKREVVLNFNDPHQMDFLPGMVSLAAGDAEAGSGEKKEGDKFARYFNNDNVLQRPIVREKIDPPAGFFPSQLYQASGKISYTCERIKDTDADGNVYVWRENTARPKETWMYFFDRDNNRVAEWDLEENLFLHSDGSNIKPETQSIGEVTDGDCTELTAVKNAPDKLWRIEKSNNTGKFNGITYVQRTETTNGLPPMNLGVYTDPHECRIWFRCTAGQAQDNEVYNAPVSGMYFFYSQTPNNPEKKGAAGPPGWVWALVAIAIFIAVALVASIVYFKVKGAPKFLSSKKAEGGEIDEDSKYKLQRTFLYDDDASAPKKGKAPETTSNGDQSL